MINENNQRKIGVILSYVIVFINTIIQLCYTPILIKNLGQSEYGLYSLANSIIGSLAILDLGFGNAIIVYTSKYHAKKEYEKEKKLHGMFKIAFYIMSFIIIFSGSIFYFNIDALFSSSMSNIEINKIKIITIILIFNLFLSFIFGIYSSIITAYEKFNFQKILGIISTLLKPLIMLPLLFMNFKSITMTIVITIVNIMVLISNYIYCRKKLNIKIKYNGFDKQIFVTILGYSIWIFLGAIADKINWSIDNFILGSIIGTSAVSIYSVALQFNTLFINLSTAISGVMLPKISKMISLKCSDEELTNEFIKIGRLQYLVIFLLISGFILFGKNFIIIWAGNEYILSYYVAIILIVPLCIPLIENLGLSILQAKNKFKFRTIMMSIMSIFNLIISVILAKKLGPIGSAIGTSVSLIVVNIVAINIYYYKVININIIRFFKEIFKMTIPYIIPISIVLVLMNIFKLNIYCNLLVFGSLYTLLYILFSYLFSMNEYEKSIVKKIIKMK